MLLWAILPSSTAITDVLALQARIRELEAENAALRTANLLGNSTAAFEPRRLASEDPVTCSIARRTKQRQLREGPTLGTCHCEGIPIGPGKATAPDWAKTTLSSMYDAHATLNGEPVPLSRYRAKATLIVNVASA